MLHPGESGRAGEARRPDQPAGRAEPSTARVVNDPAILACIKQYELAYRMQTAVPAPVDIAAERKVLETYGADPQGVIRQQPPARRLTESGVRFVQLYEKGWDVHGEIAMQHTERCRAVDRPIARSSPT